MNEYPSNCFNMGSGMVVEMDVKNAVTGTNDYQKLKNKPKINNTELVDNYDEIDPTVPDWVKSHDEPREMTTVEIATIWNSVF